MNNNTKSIFRDIVTSVDPFANGSADGNRFVNNLLELVSSSTSLSDFDSFKKDILDWYKNN